MMLTLDRSRRGQRGPGNLAGVSKGGSDAERDEAIALGAARERQRLADSLHASTVQELVLARMLVDLAVVDGSVEQLDRVRGLLEGALTQLRSLACELRCPVLQQRGLFAAIEWLADALGARWRLAHRCRLEGKPSALPRWVEELVFQAAHEFITNAGRHASASSVDIQLSFADDGISLSICDDGVGIGSRHANRTDDPLDGGFGLFSLRARVEPAGGTLVVQPREEGRGSAARLWLPLELTAPSGQQ